MVTLPRLTEYSKADVDYIKKISPASLHYLQLIEKSPSNFVEQIKLERHRSWLRCSFATFFDRVDAEQVCYFWSAQADQIIQQVWKHCGLDQLPVSLYALGKWGSRELNLSSDVDVVFAKKNNCSEADMKAIHVGIKKFIQILSQPDAWGFVFRVDTNLRPGGIQSPLIPDEDGFIHFYGYQGETWHRLSFVRFRSIAMGPGTTDAIVNFIQNFSFPRHLDFSIINAIMDLRAKLQKKTAVENLDLDIKHLSGGIRDIELYIQSLQVIHGGRKPMLQSFSMTKAMESLSELDILSEEKRDFFQSFYWQLRKIENHIHCYQDQHTYNLEDKILPLLKDKIDKNSLLQKFDQSNELISSFFSTESPEKKQLDESLQAENISSRSKQALQEIIDLRSSSLKRNEVDQQKILLLSQFLDCVDEIAFDKELAIETFRDLIFSIKSKSSIFFLLNRKPELIRQLAYLFSFSPFVGRILCTRPELIDSFALGSVEIRKEADLEELLEDLSDYKLLGQLISSSYFLRDLDVSKFCYKLTENADHISKTLLAHLSRKFPESNLSILCLGKWGGHELGIKSDLDFVFVTEQDAQKDDFLVAKRFTNLVSSPSKGGKLFDIDMRLKPNDHAGPLIVSKSDLKHFIVSGAEAWQKQAYLKSRFLGKSLPFVDAIFPQLKVDRNEVEEMKTILNRLMKPMVASSIDLKYNPGGLVHTEFILQILVLKNHIKTKMTSTEGLLEVLPIDQSTKERIWSNYTNIRTTEQLFTLCTDYSGSKITENHAALQRISKVLKLDDPYAASIAILKDQEQLLNSLDATH